LEDKVMDDSTILMKNEFIEINQDIEIVNEPIEDELESMNINDLELTFGLDKQSI